MVSKVCTMVYLLVKYHGIAKYHGIDDVSIIKNILATKLQIYKLTFSVFTLLSV